MAEPIGWSSMRSSLHYKSVLPSVPDVGMQVNLHKNLAKRLQPKEMVLFGNTSVDTARKILHRQRVALKLYSGSRLNLKGSTLHETSSRLHGQVLRQQTCPDGFLRDGGEDNYSNYRSEGSTMLTEASLYGTLPLISAGAERGGRGGGMSPIPSSANSRLGVTDRLTTYDPEKQPNSRGYLVKLKKPIVYKKKYTENEIQNIVKRLTEFDPLTHPAESKGAVRERPSIVTQMPRQSMTQIKKCTAEEVHAIVERLYKFDTSKWPPESKSRIFMGRPERSMTAPADMTLTRNAKPASPFAPVLTQRGMSIDENSQGSNPPPPPLTISQQNSVTFSDEHHVIEDHPIEEEQEPESEKGVV